MRSDELERLLESAAELARSPDEADSEPYWRAVQRLHDVPSRLVFERSLAWASSADVDERRLGADVLGQLGCKDRAFPFRGETIPILEHLLADGDNDVVESALVALGHLGSDGSVGKISALASHDDRDIRYAVTFALLGREVGLAVDTLIVLSSDADDDVRDWATFGISAQIDWDTPQIREALLARLEDPDEDTRSEAIAGLARRGDSRVLPHLRCALESEIVGRLEVEAARDLGSGTLVAALEHLRTWWTLDPELLDAAIAQCRKKGAMEAG